MAHFDPAYLRDKFNPLTRAYAGSNRWRARLASDVLDDVETAIAEACTWEFLNARADTVEGVLPDYRCTRGGEEFDVETTLLLSTPVSEWTDLHPRSEVPIDRHFTPWTEPLRALLEPPPRQAPSVTLFVTLHEDATDVLCRDVFLERLFEDLARIDKGRSAVIVAGFGNYPHPARVHGGRHPHATRAFPSRLIADVPFVV